MTDSLVMWGGGGAIAILVLDRVVQLIRAMRTNGHHAEFDVDSVVDLKLTRKNVDGMVESLEGISRSLAPLPEAMNAVLETSRQTLTEIRAHREGAKGLASHVEQTVLKAIVHRRPRRRR